MPQITLPSLGENIESGDILSILVSEGDTVSVEQDLLEIETDKATVPVPSPSAGKITKILVKEGETVAVGAAIFEIEAGEAAPKEEAPKAEPPKAEKAETPKPAPKKEEPKQAEDEPKEPASSPTAEDMADGIYSPETEPAPKPAAKPAPKPAAPAPKPAPVADSGESHGAAAAASPSVRRLARELGVDLRRVRASGSGGRVTEDDVQAHVRASQEQARAAAPSSGPGVPSSDSQGAVRRERMSRLRQTIARNMVASYTTIPQLTNFDDVDVSELEEIRLQSKEDYAAQGLKLTQMPFLIKAIAGALKRHPIVNSSVDMEAGEIIYKEYVHIGVAVDTDRGLVVPVIRDADRLSISQIARELDRLIEKAREGSLAIEEMRDGTFTISNMGAVGGTYSTPIINPPQVAILLVGRSRMLPTVIGKGKEAKIEPRLVMPLSLTYDHRAVDGADAARFVNELKGFLAAPGRLLLAP